MEAASLAEHYRELDDDALLRIAADRKDLTFEATIALEAELSARRLSQSQIDELASGDRLAERREARKTARKKAVNGLTQLHGHWHAQRKMNLELYTATSFVTIFWFPLIPIGTFKVLGHRGVRRWYAGYKTMEQIPIDWRQVLWIWCRSLLVLFVVVRVLEYFGRR